MINVSMVFERFNDIFDPYFSFLESDSAFDSEQKNVAIIVAISASSSVIILASISWFVIWKKRRNMGKVNSQYVSVILQLYNMLILFSFMNFINQSLLM